MTEPRDVLEKSRVVAVVGASTDPVKAAHRIPAVLQQAGFRIIPVNPSAPEVLGEKAYARLEDIPGPVDVVEVFRPSSEAGDIAREAVKIGAKGLWLQLGIVSDEAESIAAEAGLGFIQDRCMGQQTRALGITKN
ncbi:MAG: CoA-binding protein [Actinomycetota bacterium]